VLAPDVCWLVSSIVNLLLIYGCVSPLKNGCGDTRICGDTLYKEGVEGAGRAVEKLCCFKISASETLPALQFSKKFSIVLLGYTARMDLIVI
jgi:hypothetical protein